MQVFSLFLLLTGLLGTGVFLVMEGDRAPDSQYVFALLYSYYSIIFYFPVCVAYIGWSRTLKAIRITCRPEYAAAIGFLWICNYVFILVASPFIINAVQIILTSMQTLIVYSINRFMFNLRMPAWKHIAVFVGVVAGLLGTFDASFKDPKSVSGIRMVFVCLVFILNTFANGVSNVMLEALFELFFPFRRPAGAVVDDAAVIDDAAFEPLLAGAAAPQPEHALNAAPPPAGDDDVRSPHLDLTRKEFAILINVSYNVWSIFFWLTLFWVPAFVTGQPFILSVDFFSIGHVWFILMSISTYVYTIGANFLVFQESSLYPSIASNAIGVFQSLLFCGNFMGRYKSVPDTYAWICVGLSTVSSLVYAMKDDEKDPGAIRRSIFYRMYAPFDTVDRPLAP